MIAAQGWKLETPSASFSQQATMKDGTLRTVVTNTGGGLDLAEMPSPHCLDHGVRIRVSFVGICGSDLHYAATGKNGNYVVTAPMILGHEIVGVVDEIGRAVQTDCAIGDRVAVHPAWPCPTPGDVTPLHPYHLDRSGTYLGSASTIPHTDGGLAEYLLVRPDQLRKIPDGLPLSRAVLAEPLAVALHAVNRAGNAVDKGHALVIGAGPIGILTLAALQFRGAAKVDVSDLHESPLKLAALVGAHGTYNISQGNTPATDSYEVVIEASGSVAGLRNALEAVRRGGTIIQLGILPSGDLPVEASTIVAKEITYAGSQRFLGELDESLELLTHRPDLSTIISHTIPLEESVRAFDLATDSAVSSKVVIRINE